MTEEQKIEHKKRFNIKLTKRDYLGIAILVISLIVLSYPQYLPKGECEVARPGYKCETAHKVMIENCDYWGNFSCNTNADVSLPQIEWYIGNLCGITKNKDNLDCSNLKAACNQISGKQVCPV
jgi:hypothetical protein